MNLPFINAPLLAWFQPHGSYINRESNSASVLSIIDRFNGLLAIQNTVANQPTVTSLNNSYGAITFAGSSYMSCNTLGSQVSGKAFTVSFIAECSTPASGTPLVVVSLGNSATTAKFQLAFASGNLTFTAVNDSATSTSASAATDNKIHVYTILFDTTQWTVRVDGVQVLNHSTASTFTTNLFTLGALNSNGSVSDNFLGGISDLVVYSGAISEVGNVEAYLLNIAGIRTSGN